MDNLQSVSGKENYVHLYTTERAFRLSVAKMITPRR